MIFQAIILVLALFFFLFFSNGAQSPYNVKFKKLYICLLMVLCIAQSGLRDLSVGADTLNYRDMFYGAGMMSWQEILEFFSDSETVKDPGYLVFNKLFYIICPSYRMFLIVTAIIFFYSLGKFLERYTTSLVEVMVAIALYQCLFYSFFSITGVRQTLATAILLLSIPYAIDRRFIKFILLVILASTQHQSALIFSLFYILPLLRNSLRVQICSVVMYFLIAYVGVTYLSIFLLNTMFDNYAHYLLQQDYEGAKVFLYFMWFLFVGLLFLKKGIQKSGENSYVFANAVSVAFILTPLILLNPSNMRILQYFSICSLIILPRLCLSFGRKYLVFVSLSIFLFLSAYTLYRQTEYKFFWQVNSIEATLR